MASRGVGRSSGKYKFVKPKTKHVVERIIFGMSSNKIDPNLVSLGQKYCVAIIEEKIPTGVILRGDCSRKIVDLAYVDKKSEAGSGFFFHNCFFPCCLVFVVHLPICFDNSGSLLLRLRRGYGVHACRGQIQKKDHKKVWPDRAGQCLHTHSKTQFNFGFYMVRERDFS